MKKIILLVLLSSISITVMADELKTQFVIWSKTGTQVAYALIEKPKVTFTDTEVIITTNGVEANYDLEEMARFTYENNDITVSITNLETNKSNYKITDESLLFYALKANSNVSVYSHNGTLIFKRTICQNGDYAFTVSNLEKGVYIIKVNELTYKIVIK